MASIIFSFYLEPIFVGDKWMARTGNDIYLRDTTITNRTFLTVFTRMVKPKKAY